MLIQYVGYGGLLAFCQGEDQINHRRNYMRQVRLALNSDVPDLLGIYRYYVEQTVVSFEYDVPSLREFERRVNVFSKDCPYLVYCEGGQILGYAYAHPAFERAAYSWCAETVIYLAHNVVRQGIGSALYDSLLPILKLQGYKTLYAIIEAGNTASCKFHESKGYHLAALFPRAGYKLGRWLDVAWYERNLGDFADAPTRPVPFCDLPNERVRLILESLGQTQIS